MAVTFIASVSKASADSNGFTTDAIDTTNAKVLVLAVSYLQGAAPTVSDSKGNSWSGLTAQENASGSSVRIYYVANPTVGTGHTFTVAGAASFPALCVAAFNGVVVTSPFDQQNGAKSAGAATLQTGSVTPSENNELLIAAVGANSNPSSIDSSFTLQESEDASVNNFGCGLAYLIQTTAAAVNPQWTIGASTNLAVAIATFKVSRAGGMLVVF